MDNMKTLELMLLLDTRWSELQVCEWVIQRGNLPGGRFYHCITPGGTMFYVDYLPKEKDDPCKFVVLRGTCSADQIIETAREHIRGLWKGTRA